MQRCLAAWAFLPVVCVGLAPVPSVDYVIVGGGTAGCVLANRLTEDTSKQVLLLEPGPSARGSLKVAVPVALTKLFNSVWDWKYKSTPTERTGGREVHLCRGKCLGGSSATNALLYHRGTARDFDAWNLDGWDSEAMLESFVAVERNRRRDLADSPFHGIEGLVSVEDARYTNPLSSRFMEAARDSGFPHNDDFNDWSRPQTGVGRFQLHARRGRRAHAAATHLRPALRRRNLHVRTGASASQVVLDDQNVAQGVKYLDLASGEEAFAPLRAPGQGSEVLLSAGAVTSPQLLMLSGIGPREELEAHGIPLRVDLPGVGKNLADHPAVVVGYKINQRCSITDKMMVGKGRLNPLRVAEWLGNGSGPLATSGCDFGGFFHTRRQKAGTDEVVSTAAKDSGSESDPDLQMRFIAGLGTSPDGVSSYEDIGRAGQPQSGITFQSVGIRPLSRGSVKLRSADPLDAPLIDPAFCMKDEDVATLREGIRLSRTLAKQPAFEDLRDDETWPGAALTSDKDLDKYIASTVHSANALAGSCKIGVRSDAMAVLNTDLCVRGTAGLRVVDASVLPTMPGGQLGATVFALAERASGIIIAGVGANVAALSHAELPEESSSDATPAPPPEPELEFS